MLEYEVIPSVPKVAEKQGTYPVGMAKCVQSHVLVHEGITIGLRKRRQEDLYDIHACRKGRRRTHLSRKYRSIPSVC